MNCFLARFTGASQDGGKYIYEKCETNRKVKGRLPKSGSSEQETSGLKKKKKNRNSCKSITISDWLEETQNEKPLKVGVE